MYMNGKWIAELHQQNQNVTKSQVTKPNQFNNLELGTQKKLHIGEF